LEGAMRRQPREYDLAELIDNPGLGLAMEYDGVDRRTIELLLERQPRQGRPAPVRFDHPIGG
jgi:hypothetical protein